jgi:hypothetical protein
MFESKYDEYCGQKVWQWQNILRMCLLINFTSNTAKDKILGNTKNYGC